MFEPGGGVPLSTLRRRPRRARVIVRTHFIIVMIRWIGLAPWEFEFPFPGSLTPTFLFAEQGSAGQAVHGEARGRGARARVPRLRVHGCRQGVHHLREGVCERGRE